MKNLLVVTYYWPPAGGPGVHRVLRFAPHLVELGWRPIVLTVKDAEAPSRDDSLVQLVPSECEVIRTSALSPFRVYRWLTGRVEQESIPTTVLSPRRLERRRERIARWIRAQLFVPDARIGWYPAAVRAGRRLLRDRSIDLILSTSPPPTVHLIAKKLAQLSGRKWVADFRDPWSQPFWMAEARPGPLAARVNARLEASVLQQADSLLTVTPGLSSSLSLNSPAPCHVIHNGFERQLATVPSTPTKQDSSFLILFFGHLNKYHPWQALLESIARLPVALREKIKVQFVGHVFDDVANALRKVRHVNVELTDYMPYVSLMNFAARASLLFRPLAPIGYSAIGAKTYDYLALRKPILAIGATNGMVGELLRSTQRGQIFAPTEIDAITSYLQTQIQAWVRHGIPMLPESDRLKAYRTDVNAKRLAQILNQLVES